MSSVPVSAPAGTQRRLGRSVAAILGGFVFVVIISLVTDELFHVAKVYPPWGQLMSDKLFALATAYRLVFGVAGSCVTARLAPYRPMLHSVIGAVIGMVLSTLATLGTWNKPEMGPHWYPIVLIATALPTAWLGAWIFAIAHKK